MTLAVADAGTKNVAALATPYTLNASTYTTLGAYTLYVSAPTLANGDSIDVRMKEKVTGSGGTQRVVTLATISNAQGSSNNLSVMVSVLAGVGTDFEVEQTTGTPIGNNLEYSIRAAT